MPALEQRNVQIIDQELQVWVDYKNIIIDGD